MKAVVAAIALLPVATMAQAPAKCEFPPPEGFEYRVQDPYDSNSVGEYAPYDTCCIELWDVVIDQNDPDTFQNYMDNCGWQNGVCDTYKNSLGFLQCMVNPCKALAEGDVLGDGSVCQMVAPADGFGAQLVPVAPASGDDDDDDDDDGQACGDIADATAYQQAGCCNC